MKLVDLFCGCGGFSLGAHRAGFEVAAAFDIDPILTSSYSRNFPRTKLHLADVAALSGAQIKDAAGGRIDGLFGGPPCQGFSEIGRRDVNDERRQLLEHFFRLVAEVRPTFFIMENVPGLAYEGARGVLDIAIERVASCYELVGPHVWDASQFGAPTKRRRIFVLGVHRTYGNRLSLDDIAVNKKPPVTVREAINDLRNARRLLDLDGFDLWKIARPGAPSKYAAALRAKNGHFTGHRFTKHTKSVVDRFSRVAPGDVDQVGRHPRLAWNAQCPTLRAGTGADRGSYQSVRPVHPDENRVITVREAARLQGFPDKHMFHPTVWHSFRMIGNSVSPIIARAMFDAVRSKISGEIEADIETQRAEFAEAAE